MDSDQIKEIKIPKIDFNKIKFPIIAGLLVISAYFCFYQVEAEPNAIPGQCSDHSVLFV